MREFWGILSATMGSLGMTRLYTDSQGKRLKKYYKGEQCDFIQGQG